MLECVFSLTCILSYKDKICDSGPFSSLEGQNLRFCPYTGNTGTKKSRKPVFWRILRNIAFLIRIITSGAEFRRIGIFIFLYIIQNVNLLKQAVLILKLSVLTDFRKITYFSNKPNDQKCTLPGKFALNLASIDFPLSLNSQTLTASVKP